MVILQNKSRRMGLAVEVNGMCLILLIGVNSTGVVTVKFSRLNPSSIGDKATSLWLETYLNRGEKFSFALEEDSVSLEILEKKQSSAYKSSYSLMHSDDVFCLTSNPLRFLSLEQSLYLLLFSRFL